MSTKVLKAIEIAHRAHEGQTRKGRNAAPYIIHPVFVGIQLARLGYEEEVIIAGILHDVIEDGYSNLSRDEVKYMIKKWFGDKILKMVEDLSEPKDPSMSKEQREKTWEKRNQIKFDKLKDSIPEVRAISAVDIYASLIELEELIKQEGAEAGRYFNTSFKNKLDHMKKLLELYGESDRGCPYSVMISEIKEHVYNIENKLNKLIK